MCSSDLGDPKTQWVTNWYGSPEFGNLKPGVGMIVDLAKPQEVSDILIRFGAEPTTYQIFTAPSDATEAVDQAPGTTNDWIAQGEPEQTDEADTSYRLTTPVTTRFVLLWLKELPPEIGVPGHWRGYVNELTLKGPAS